MDRKENQTFDLLIKALAEQFAYPLYFLDDNHEVYLETDASAYAIGAYLNQTIK